MFFGRDLFADQEEWFVETVKAAAANDRVNWIVKLHPANVWKRRRDGVVGELDEHVAIREQVGALPAHVKLLDPDTEISTWSLFAVTDYGVTIRGSVGFELPCFGKPALTAGTGFYSGRGFTVDSDSREQYLARLASVQELEPPAPDAVELARRHAHALFRLRQTRFTSYRSVYKPLERIADLSEATIEVFPESAEELAARRRPTPARRLGRRLPSARLPRAVGRSCRCAAARAAGRRVVARRGSVVRPDLAAALAQQTQRRRVAAAVRVAERPRPAGVLDERARALELRALGGLVEQAEPPVLPAVPDHLVAAAHELAALVERQVELVRERTLVLGHVLGEERVEELSSPPSGQALLERALDEDGLRRVVAVRRRVLRPEPVGVVRRGEDALAERAVVAARREQELRLLHVERHALRDGAAGRAEDAVQPAPLERGCDRLEVLDEAVVERQQAGVLRPLAREVGEAHALVARGDVVELALELGDRAGVDARAVAHVVVHHDRQAHVRSNAATNAVQNASPAGERSSGRCHASASRL